MTPDPVDPLPRALRHGLRALVMELTAWGRTQRFPAAVSVGTPGGDRLTWTLTDEPADHALRAEIVAALLGRARPDPGDPAPVCWLTRPGVTRWHDLDAAWLPAALTAYAEAGVPLTFVVVTKTAWWDPCTDRAQRWRRPRRR